MGGRLGKDGFDWGGCLGTAGGGILLLAGGGAGRGGLEDSSDGFVSDKEGIFVWKLKVGRGMFCC